MPSNTPVSKPSHAPRLRVAGAEDADALAALHAESWRSSYRGSYSDAYLDGPIVPERRHFWRQRYAHPRAGLWSVMAEGPHGELLGFVCLLADHDPHWGTLIDNVHVASGHKGQGIGRMMMAAAAEHLLHQLPRRPIYLTVLESNLPARAFYRRIGGETAEHLVQTVPDGSQVPVLRIAWASPAALAEGTGG